MPVYNTSEFLEAAINSILNQTHTDFELIIINDCSTDNSEALIKGFLSDPRIRYFSLEKNVGIGGVRNKGLELVKGKYFSFVDSDDSIDLDLLQNVFNILETFTYELVVYGVKEVYSDKNGNIVEEIPVALKKELDLKTEAEVRSNVVSIEESTLFGYTCNKFYNLNMYKTSKIEFIDLALIEDFDFNLRMIHDVSSLYAIPRTFYNYNKRKTGNLTSRFVSDYFELHVTRVNSMYETVSDWGYLNDESRNILLKQYIRYYISALERNFDTQANLTKKDIINWIKDNYSNALWLKFNNTDTVDGFASKMVLNMIRKERSLMIYYFGFFVSKIKTSIPGLFDILKRRGK